MAAVVVSMVVALGASMAVVVEASAVGMGVAASAVATVHIEVVTVDGDMGVVGGMGLAWVGGPGPTGLGTTAITGDIPTTRTIPITRTILTIRPILAIPMVRTIVAFLGMAQLLIMRRILPLTDQGLRSFPKEAFPRQRPAPM